MLQLNEFSQLTFHAVMRLPSEQRFLDYIKKHTTANVDMNVLILLVHLQSAIWRGMVSMVQSTCDLPSQ